MSAKGGYTTEKEITHFYESRYLTALVSICVFFVRINKEARNYLAEGKRTKANFISVYEQLFHMEFKAYQTKPSCFVDFSEHSEIRETIESLLTKDNPNIIHDRTRSDTLDEKKKKRKMERQSILKKVHASEVNGCPLEVKKITELDEFCVLRCLNSGTGNEFVDLRNFDIAGCDAPKGKLLLGNLCDRLRQLAKMTPAEIEARLGTFSTDSNPSLALLSALTMATNRATEFATHMQDSIDNLWPISIKQFAHSELRACGEWAMEQSDDGNHIYEEHWYCREPHNAITGFYLAQHIHRYAPFLLPTF